MDGMQAAGRDWRSLTVNDLMGGKAGAARPGVGGMLAAVAAHLGPGKLAELGSLAGLAALAYAVPAAAVPSALAATAIAGRVALEKRPPRPAPRAPSEATVLTEGACFLGNEDATGREVWLAPGEMLDHMLVLGGTGSGKTVFLLGVMANAMAAGAGCLFVDGKGDVGTYAKVMGLASLAGRVDEVLTLNLMGEGDGRFRDGSLQTHTYNPLARADEATLARLLAGCPDIPADRPQWRERIDSLCAAVAAVLSHDRSATGAAVTPSAAFSLLSLGSLVEAHERLSEGGAGHGAPAAASRVAAYLSRLPGFNMSKGTGQDRNTLEQHGFGEMVVGRAIGTLARDHAYAFETGRPDIDMEDVVANGRILVVLLPALGKSRDEVATLGRLLVTDLEATLERVEARRHAERRAVPAGTHPFVAVVDRFGYYGDRIPALFATATACGVSLVLSAQDVRQGAPVREALNHPPATVVAMRTEDPDTAMMVARVSGKGPVADDLRGLREGQAFLIGRKGKPRRMTAMHADPSPLVDGNMRMGPDHLVRPPSHTCQHNHR